MPRTNRRDVMPVARVCKICGQPEGVVEFYPPPPWRARDYCRGCNTTAVRRRKLLAMARRGKLDEAIDRVRAKITEMERVRDRAAIPGLHPVDW